MDERYPGGGYQLKAPGAETSTTSYQLPGIASPLHVDEHMEDIDFRSEEKIGGKVYKTMGSELPHAAQNGEIDYVLRGLLKSDYCVASDLKTRFDEESDFASDSAAVKRGTDRKTGRRHLERLAFEVVWKQSRSSVTAKAPRMIRRGVHRVFAIFVRAGEVAEWSKAKKEWVPLAPTAVIRDTCLAKPLPVSALLDAGKADVAVIQGLEAKGHPEIQRIRDAGLREGETVGLERGKEEGQTTTLRKSILTVCAARDLALSEAVLAAVDACDDNALLERWLANAANAKKAEDLLK